MLLKPYTTSKMSVLAGLSILFCANLSAAAITGGFGTTGAGVMTFANGAGAHFLDWCPTDPSSPAGSTCVGASGYAKGDILVSGGTGTFTPVNPTSTGTIKDITDATPPAANFAYLPVGPATTTLNNFIFLNALPNLNFVGFNLVPVTCIATPTQLCLGGFVLSQVGENVSVSISAVGAIYDTTGVLTPASFSDIITGQYTKTTIAAVAAAANSPAGIFSNTWSQSVTTGPIPEPGTVFLLGSALLLLPLARRRLG